MNLGDLARGRTGNLQGRLARFQLNDPLVFGDRVALVDEELQHVARIDAFAEVRKFDFNRHRVQGSGFRVLAAESLFVLNPEP
jgi:hypothetical protein